MESKRVIMIDEESFRGKTFEVIDHMHDDGGLGIALVAVLAFAQLQSKLFHPQEVPEETEQE